MQIAQPALASRGGAAAGLSVVPTQMLTLDGLHLHYADLPAEGPEAGAPLLFVHGLGGWLRNWAANLPYMTACGYRCVALDLPGFGHSAKPDVAYDMPYFRGVLTAFLDALDIPRATLIGNSMGGLVTLAMAVRNPERVDHLVLVDAAGVHPLRRTALALTLETATLIVRKAGNLDRIMRSMRRWVFEQQPPELLEELRIEMSKYAQEDRDARRARARASRRALWNIARADFRPWLPTISAPTLVIHGKQDKLVPLEAASILHREIPHAKLCTFDHCGHVPQMEVPDKFNARLAEFLADSRPQNGASR